VGCCHSILQCLSRNGGEGARAATKSQRKAWRWSRRRPASIGAAQGFAGQQEASDLALNDRRAQSSQRGASFVTKCGLAYLLSCLAYTSVHIVQTDELHTLVNAAVQVASIREETSTDVSPISRIPSIYKPHRSARLSTQSMPALSTYLPQRPMDPSEPHA